MFVSSPPLKSIVFPLLKHQVFPSPLGLATSLSTERSYEPRVEGMVPKGLQGTLYRNGPGLFDRGGLRKRNILDGDGLIQAFRFQEDAVQYQNRFVRTRKYVDETKAGRFLYSTWTTQAPGGLLSNFMGGKRLSQACVTVFLRHGRLYAFDDGLEAYELDPISLETIGPTRLGLSERHHTFFAAQSKYDGRTGEWILIGRRGEDTVITVLDRNGKLNYQRIIESPRHAFMHDFFVSDHYIILNYQPAFYNKTWSLFGRRSFAESIQWRPEEGNIILVLDRSGRKEPTSFISDPVWMWHSLNAYDQDNEIIADFVGYDYPD
ncbi:MAG: carotenoid oxygenase family protein, partial [Candidatus Ranarchaeia archaeon]